MNWNGWHFGRSFGGAGHLEESCPCPKAACGLPVYGFLSDDCDQHPPMRGKTIRTSHSPRDCPCLTEEVMAAAHFATYVPGTMRRWSQNGVNLVFSVAALELTRRAAAQAHGMTVGPGLTRLSLSPAFVNLQKQRNRNFTTHVELADWEREMLDGS